MAVTLATLISAYQARLNDVLSASGPGPAVELVVDDIQPLLEQPALLGEVRAEVWCSGTEVLQHLGGADQVEDTIEVSVGLDTVFDQRPDFERLLEAEDRVRETLLASWDGKPCATLLYSSTSRTRVNGELASVVSFETVRIQSKAAS